VILLIIGATGTISRSFSKYLTNVPGERDINGLQKIAMLGKVHILRKV
jgi:hypothetical protein